MTERRIKPSFSFQRTINAHKEGHKLIIRGDLFMSYHQLNIFECTRIEVLSFKTILLKENM